MQPVGSTPIFANVVPCIEKSRGRINDSVSRCFMSLFNVFFWLQVDCTHKCADSRTLCNIKFEGDVLVLESSDYH